ncbi:PP2C family protein-serine/threonine phosphatase [Streptomyces sp. WMMC500]|uniref:PP2C family protein-serine/threonine phosphatase n=1 Tax=Streptomyces sp. WMMC500 TaxID=3015154 RepID=UPI00248B7F4F|nr:PP2C family protein-serine/threonine phosphatase [Streptomyces sp. WMMC500]WBB64479.1 PP2C family protein-serine/threonine phosphatase [Streptomyces sp. WMMC500]
MNEPQSPKPATPVRAVLSALPYAVMTVVAVVDISAGPEVGYLPLVSLGPAFAGLVGGWRRTALIGALALLLCAALAQYNGLLGDRRGYTAMFSVVAVTAAGLAAVRMRQAREAELANVRSIAETAQRVLLRPVPLAAGKLRIALSYTSAVADARIGGDLYEVVTSPAGVRVIVGDVQGKGLEAVEAAAVVLSAFREAAYDEPDLQAVGERVERALDRQLPSEKFVTTIMAEIGDEPAVTLLNYGHPAPLAVRSDGDTRLLEPPARALPLGLGMHGTAPPRPHVHPFSPGDQILFYTDGVTEARNEQGAFYSLTRSTPLLRDADADTALAAVRQDLIDYVGGPLQDDAAMLLLRYRREDAAQQA